MRSAWWVAAFLGAAGLVFGTALRSSGQGYDDGYQCIENYDCASGICTDGICAAEPPETCHDDIQNQDETDVDCGGRICRRCEDGCSCYLDVDCQGGYCQGGYCANQPEPACDDLVRNLDETDIDCGGRSCEPCGLGKICLDDRDCESDLEIGKK